MPSIDDRASYGTPDNDLDPTLHYWKQHTPRRPFCDDMGCDCHRDEQAIKTLGDQYQDGLVSASDADKIFRGKTV